MATVTVFRQERVDGGVRTGIDYEGLTILESYTEGTDEGDPALLWYVDVRFSGDLIPARSPEIVRNWLLNLSDHVQPQLAAIADELAAGIDGLIPIQRNLNIPIAGLSASVAATGMRRLTGREIGLRIRDFAGQWRAAISSVQPLAPIS